MRAIVLIEELGDEVGFCLVIQSGWTEDAQFKLAVHQTGPLDAKSLAEGLRYLAMHVEERILKAGDPLVLAIEKVRSIEL